MISIVKHRKTDKIYTFSLIQDDSVLITEKGYFSKAEKLFFFDDFIRVKLETLYEEKIESLPKDINLFIEESIKGSFFTIYEFRYYEEKLRLKLSSYSDVWMETSIYNPLYVFKKFRENLPPNFSYSEFHDDDNDFHINLYYERMAGEYLTLGAFVEEGISRLKKLEKIIGINLRGLRWKEEYEKDEALFSKEVISVVLRKMGFRKISYTHGCNEYGRDFIFSTIDKFGNNIHHGMQVKVGDINGKVNGQIDELIGQLDDAFKMPFKRENEPPSYISFFHVAISGKFTENAKEKLRNKIPKEFISSVSFIDKERIIELILKYC